MELQRPALVAREVARPRGGAHHNGELPREMPDGAAPQPNLAARAPADRAPGCGLPAASRALLERILALGLVDVEQIDAFLTPRRDRLGEYTREEHLGQALVRAGLLTAYQLDRILAGSTHGLVLGSYRVLDRLGSGGMGVVFLGEHYLLRRRVAIKVLPADEDCPASLRQRFFAEMRVLAELCHPNIVLALDAGDVRPDDRTLPELVFLVMELVDGGDLEQQVCRDGPCDVARACDYVRQAACGLQAAHDHHVVHRDVKPSNLLLTRTGQVKLVDFGLARQFSSRLTDPRALLGSVEFMAPEQSHDPSAVGRAADVYGLGASLFWLLTGEALYVSTPSVAAALRALQQEAPRRLRQLRPDIPEALDDLVARMLRRDPVARPGSPLAVMNALEPFADLGRPFCRSSGWAESREQGRPVRALIVDHDPSACRLHRGVLESLGAVCTEVGDGAAALSAAASCAYDVVLLELSLPDLRGIDVCRRLRDMGTEEHQKVLMVSGAEALEDLAAPPSRGPDDYLVKPLGPAQLAARVRHALRLKEAQDCAVRLAAELREAHRQLQLSLDARDADVHRAHDALLYAMAKMAESRDGETPGHMRRLQYYTRLLAQEAAARWPTWAGMVDDRFLTELQRCVPLHDIGKIGLPDEVLLKPAALDAGERLLVETHPIIGDRILEALGREHGTALEFLGMARGIVRHHHERWDGSGYPDRLAGDAIPAAARLVAVADVYDALRRQRPHKPALAHATAMGMLLSAEGQFDPTLIRSLIGCEHEWQRIYVEVCE
jgi:response regulator RpfG family c-di-GMP phosphodiesterase